MTMTHAKVGEVLRQRLAFDQEATRWPKGRLRLASDGLTKLGALLTPTGWTAAERDQALASPASRGLDEQSAIAAYWLRCWKFADESAAWLRQAANNARIPSGVRSDALTRVHTAPGGFYAPPELAAIYARAMDCPYDLADQGPDAEPRYRTLAIFGPVGCGKTTLAAAWLLKELEDRSVAGLFISARELAEEVRASPKSACKFAADYGLLVIDDVGAEAEDLRSANVSAITRVLGARSAEEGACTAFTTSRTASELRKAFGTYGYSRLMDRALPLLLDGPDWRQKQ